MSQSVIILPHFELTKITPICNSNKNHSVNNFQIWFIGIYIFQTLLLKICSLVGYALVDALFLEKYLYIIFQKEWVRGIPDHNRLA